MKKRVDNYLYLFKAFLNRIKLYIETKMETGLFCLKSSIFCLLFCRMLDEKFQELNQALKDSISDKKERYKVA